jgi:hypothetical protein
VPSLMRIVPAGVLSTLVNAFTQAGDTGFAKAGTVTVEGQPALAPPPARHPARPRVRSR